MIKQFYDHEAAKEYVKWNGLSYTDICRGRGGRMNAVRIKDTGGVVTAPSSVKQATYKKRYSH